jgi:hypothetical protein
MFIHVRITTIYTWATTFRNVDCTSCGTPYVYAMRCMGVGGAGAPFGLGQARAQLAAQSRSLQKLKRSLQTAYEAVPCPHCASLQPEMIRLLRWNSLKLVISLWSILCGHALLFGLLGLDPVFHSAFTYAWVMCLGATSLALPAVIYAYLRTYHVTLPPHRRVVTRDRAQRDGYDSLELPYVYPDSSIHVHPSAIQFPNCCCQCNGTATTYRFKRLRLVAVRMPFCARCCRRSIGIQAAATSTVSLGFAAAIAACILSHQPVASMIPALITGAFAGLIVAIISWFKYICNLAIPVTFRRHDYRQDSAILRCQNPQFTESLLAFLLQQKHATTEISAINREDPTRSLEPSALLQSAGFGFHTQ